MDFGIAPLSARKKISLVTFFFVSAIGGSDDAIFFAHDLPFLHYELRFSRGGDPVLCD